MWMVRSPGGAHAEELIDKGVIGIGWTEANSDFLTAKTPEEFYVIVKAHWPEYKDQQVINAGRQLYKFFRQMREGDEVITYDSSARLYHVGKIVGPAQLKPEWIAHLSNFRKVDWSGTVARDDLTPNTRNSLGSTLTLFQPSDEAVQEIKNVIATPGKTKPVTLDAAEVEDPYSTASETARELIKDKLMKLSWQDMQKLVAGVLRAMGYKTKISPDGADRGRDIIASPDGLGLEQPRIFVEVKHRKGQMGADLLPESALSLR